MEYKLLEQEDLPFMLNFVDDEETTYDVSSLSKFIQQPNTYAFILKHNDQILAFAYGYVLYHPDDRKSFYFDAIDVLTEHQDKGYGTGLMAFIRDYAKKLGCYEMFLVTNKSNISACKCYEKSGAHSDSNDDIVYVYDFEGEK